MATLEKRGRHFRIVFSYGNRKFSRSLKTASEGAAQATLACVEDNLHRLSLGTIALPDGADLATFLLTDGRSSQKRTPPPLSLAALHNVYLTGGPAKGIGCRSRYSQISGRAPRPLRTELVR